MFGLLIFGGIAIWFALSFWIALRAARIVKQVWLKALVFLALGPLLFVAPVADELIGKFQYERYCKGAEEVKIYGTVPVGEGLYTADGKWKIGDLKLSFEERKRLRETLDSIVRSDAPSGINVEVSALIPIHYRDTKIYARKTGQLLAEFRIYGTRGGWLSRLLFERAGFFVEPQCLPPQVRESRVHQLILPFNGNAGGAK